MYVPTELIAFLYTLVPASKHNMTMTSVCCYYAKLTSAANVILSPEKTPINVHTISNL
jgi:hypothetical protein